MITVPTQDELRRAGVPVDTWGENGSMTFKELAGRIASEACFVDLSKKQVVSLTHIARVKVIHRFILPYKYLVEKGQERPVEGFREKYHAFPLYREFKKITSARTAVETIIRDDLGITDPVEYTIDFLTSSDDITHREFPGLQSKRIVFLCEVELLVQSRIKQIYREHHPSASPLIWV